MLIICTYDINPFKMKLKKKNNQNQYNNVFLNN